MGALCPGASCCGVMDMGSVFSLKFFGHSRRREVVLSLRFVLQVSLKLHFVSSYFPLRNVNPLSIPYSQWMSFIT